MWADGLSGDAVKDRNNIVSLAKSGEPDELASAVGELRQRMPGMIEYNRIMAKVQRDAYLAYVEQGFTAKQALELCKTLKP